jgi:hypothetical protein
VINFRFLLKNVAAMVAIFTATVAFASCELLKQQEADILAFAFEGISGRAAIDKTALTVTAIAGETVDLTAIIAEFTLSKNAAATVNGFPQVSGQSVNDFTNSVIYTVTSGDWATVNDWTVTVTGGKTDTPDPETPAFSAFSVAGQTAVIDAQQRTVKATVPCGTNLAALTPAFTLTPAGATAKVGSTPQISGTTAVNFSNPVTYTLATADGKTIAQWTVTVTLPDNCGGGEVKKYITYNQPVTAYYIEYNGGMTDANKKYGSGHYGNVVEAYESKKYTEIQWLDGSPSGWYVWYISPSGLDYTTLFGRTEWYRHTGNGGGLQDDDGWKVTYISKEYPLGYFAAYVSNYKGTNTFYKYGLLLSDIAASDNLEMPSHTEVTKLYVRSEKVMDIMCDVYKDSQTGSGGTETWTWWVDPATGFTLKYERKLRDGDIESYEVTNLVVGKPDWNGKRLHPITGDTFVDVD